MVIKMRQYHIFLVKEHHRKSNEADLYNILDNIYRDKTYLNYKVSLYNQLCDLFDVEIVENYFEKKYNLKSYNHQISLKIANIEIKKSCLKVTTNNMPYILINLTYYSPNLFVCDFMNNDYFWLNQIKNKVVKI